MGFCFFLRILVEFCLFVILVVSYEVEGVPSGFCVLNLVNCAIVIVWFLILFVFVIITYRCVALMVYD